MAAPKAAPKRPETARVLPERFLTLLEVSAMLGLHYDTVRHRATAGVIPARKQGRRTVFIESEVIAYMRNLPSAHY